MFACCRRFRELLLEVLPSTQIVAFQSLRGMPQSRLTKYLASGKVQEEIKTSTLRKEDSKSKWTTFKA